MSSRLSRALGLALVTAVTACTPPPPPEPPKVQPTATAPSATAPEVEAPVPIPVTAADPSWGSAEARVTIVEFSDFQCPFCDRARGTIEELKEAYGPDKPRIVWKNHPLPHHKNAAPAAQAAHAVFSTQGNETFWRAHHALFNRRHTLADATEQVLQSMRGKQPDYFPALKRADEKIAEDAALVKTTGVLGAPAFFINGVHLAGAQPAEKFRAIIDEQLAKAEALVQKGVAPGKVYAELTRAQFAKVERPHIKVGGSPEPEEEERQPWRLPAGKSPVRGKADALVTVVLVTDLACRSCARTAQAVSDAMEGYENDVRLVIKFHRSADKGATDFALQVALEARSKKGDAGFWKVYDALRADPPADTGDGGDAIPRAITAAGLRLPETTVAATQKKHKAVIDADEEELVEAGGFPSSVFVNGHRALAFSADSVRKAIDKELAAAKKLVEEGTPRAKLYDKMLERALNPPDPPKKTVPAPGKDTPGRGPADAKVVVQMFGNFESYASQQAFSYLADIEKDFPGKVRIVMRHLPLPVQPDSPLAAEAAIEAFAQKGDSGFWTIATSMFGVLDRIDGLSRPGLEKLGAAAGLDAPKLAAALDQRTHRAAVAADLAIAKQAGIQGPSILVNDVYLANPTAPRLRKVVRKAVAESK